MKTPTSLFTAVTTAVTLALVTPVALAQTGTPAARATGTPAATPVAPITPANAAPVSSDPSPEFRTSPDTVEPAPARPAPSAAAPGAIAPGAPPAEPVADTIPSDMPVARAEPVMERDVTTQLQIFLDQQLFGPGKIDGRPGEFTRKALLRYQRAHGLPETGEVSQALPLDSVYPVYTFYTIEERDLKSVGHTPSKPSEQAKKKYLPYTSLLEFLTERYHCAPEFLAKLNPTLNMDALKAGDTVRVPNVEPFKIEELPKQGFLPELAEYKERVITINRSEKMLELYEGESLLASVPITPGGGRLQTPAGDWKIVGIATQPTFRWDEGVLNHGVRTETFYNLPPGPNNPVGVLWIGLNKPGIGIHGTNSPQTIGRSASHGCMRVANWDVIRLSKMITKGMKVVIQ